MPRREMTADEIRDLVGEPMTLTLRNKANGRIISSIVIDKAESLAGKHLMPVSMSNSQYVDRHDVRCTISGPKGELPEFSIDLGHDVLEGICGMLVQFHCLHVEDE